MAFSSETSEKRIFFLSSIITGILIIAYLLIMILPPLINKPKEKIRQRVKFDCLTPYQSLNKKAEFYYHIQDVSDSLFLVPGDNQNPKYLDPDQYTYSLSYPKPGIYQAKIISKNFNIDTTTIVIETPDFSAGVTSNLFDDHFFDKRNVIRDSIFHIPTEMLHEKGLDTKLYWSDFKMYKNLQVSGNKFIFETEVRNVKEHGGLACCDIVIALHGTKKVIRVYFANPGCEDNIQLQIGEINIPKKSPIHEDFCHKFDKFRKIVISNNNKHVTISLDKQVLLDTTYKQDIGQLTGIDYSMRGSGQINSISLSNLDENILYQEDFKRESSSRANDTSNTSSTTIKP